MQDGVSSGVHFGLTSGVITTLGLIVGLDNLFRWFYNSAPAYTFILGLICTVCAAGWLLYVLLSKKDV